MVFKRSRSVVANNFGAKSRLLDCFSLDVRENYQKSKSDLFMVLLGSYK